VFLLLDSGLRRGERVDLNLDDVDIKTGLVTDRKGEAASGDK
jgi:integrase